MAALSSLCGTRVSGCIQLRPARSSVSRAPLPVRAAVGTDAAPEAAKREVLGKKHIAAELATQMGLKKTQGEEAVNFILKYIVENVAAGKDIAITGFGSFRTKVRSARTGRNPSTGEPLDIPSRTVVSFSAGKGFKDALNGVEPTPKAAPKAKTPATATVPPPAASKPKTSKK